MKNNISMVIILFLMPLILTGLITLILIKFITSNDTINFCVTLIIQISFITTILLAYRFSKVKFKFQKVKTKLIVYSSLIGFFFFLAYPIINLGEFFISIKNGSFLMPRYLTFNELLLNYNSYPYYYLTNTIIIMPILEEILYRGFILKKLTNNFSNIISIFISSFLFAVGHLELDKLSLSFVGGFILGCLYIRSKNIIYPIVAHITINFFHEIFHYENILVENNLKILYYLIFIPILFLIYKLLVKSKIE